MKVFSATDIGRKRKMNQDYIFTSEKPVGNLPNLFVVADGMGGHNAGDFASRYGVSVLYETILKDRNFNPVRIMRDGVEAANREVFVQSRNDPSMSGMGTTMVVCTVVGDYAYVANVGDSRLYLAGSDGLTQITQDHSLVAEMIRLGEITPEEGRTNPEKNIITRAVGTADKIKVDFFDVNLSAGDQILMCSDGLTNMVEDSRIYEILRESGREDRSRALIDEANANGGNDNIAVIVIEI